MDYEKLISAIILCGSPIGIEKCKKCAYWNEGDLSKCIPSMTNDAAAAIKTLLERAESAESRAEKAERERNTYKIFFDDISKKPDCNTCSKKECEYRPGIGKTTRFNCPLWRGLKEE